MSDVPTLRGYQPDAVADIARHLIKGGRGQLRAACGTGKTLVALRVAEKLVPHGLTVILAPSIGLVAQTLDAWKRDAVVPFAESAVCSDDTVIDGESDRVSTDADVIGPWLRRRGRKVIAGTYASAPVLGRALRETNTVADLLVCDEAHRLAGRPDKAAAVVLDGEVFPAKRRLFLTATPRLCFTENTPGLSMDNEALFGPVLCDYPFSAAIAEGWLDDYRVAAIGVTDGEIRDLLGDDGETEYVDGRTGLTLATLAAQVALARAAREYGIRRAVSFHSRVAAAQGFARTLAGTAARLPPGVRPLGPCGAYSVHGGMESVMRERILDHLRHPEPGGWSVVANAKCLGEGIDIPAIDAVMFAAPRESVTDIAQAAGRALRRHEDGTGTATIIVPVVVTGDGVSDLETGAYETVWRVVSAMREHDEALATGLDFARAHWKRHGEPMTQRGPNLPSRVVVTVSGDVGDRITRGLSLSIIQHAASPWWAGYGRAETFHAEHGHLAVPNPYRSADGFCLGAWVGHNRQCHRKGMLAPDRMAALEKLGMIWDAQEAAWENYYQAACAYRAEHGDLLVPHSHITADKCRLGVWIRQQRQRCRGGQLPAERRERLDGLDMEWHPRRWRRPWEYNLGNSRAYHEEFGDLDIPQRYQTADGIRLGAWLSVQRAAWKAGTIDPELASELEALGIRWVIRKSRKPATVA